MKNKIVYKFIKFSRFAIGFVSPRGGFAAPGRQIGSPKLTQQSSSLNGTN